jgi:hypothetical protein
MKTYTSYTKAAFYSVFIGWLVSSIVYNLLALIVIGSFDFKVWAIFFGPSSLLFSILANLIFIQIPKKRVEKIYLQTDWVAFSTASMLYGTAIYALTIGIVLHKFVYGSHLVLFFLQAVINGYVYGLVFYKTWVHTTQVKKT